LKIFVDTNIFLDVLFNRNDAVNVTRILNACHQKRFEGYVADITLLNIDYVAAKQTKNLRDFLALINQTFTVIGANNRIFESALGIDHNDLEDVVQYLCAENETCRVIVSNDKKFYRGKMEVMNSTEFVKDYLV